MATSFKKRGLGLTAGGLNRIVTTSGCRFTTSRSRCHIRLPYPDPSLIRADRFSEIRSARGMTIRRCRDEERDDILSIINAAAEAYRNAIPADRWHEPYMPGDEFDRERAAGVVFWGYEDHGRLAGVMGLQDVRDVSLIRHAYVAPAKQRDGIGGKLVAH